MPRIDDLHCRSPQSALHAKHKSTDDATLLSKASSRPEPHQFNCHTHTHTATFLMDTVQKHIPGVHQDWVDNTQPGPQSHPAKECAGAAYGAYRTRQQRKCKPANLPPVSNLATGCSNAPMTCAVIQQTMRSWRSLNPPDRRKGLAPYLRLGSAFSNSTAAVAQRPGQKPWRPDTGLHPWGRVSSE